MAAAITLLIRVWGQINCNAELMVDRDGMVYIPQVVVYGSVLSPGDLRAEGSEGDLLPQALILE